MSAITNSPKQIVNEGLQALSDFNKRVERIRKFFIYRLAKRGLLRTSAQEALGEPRRSGTQRPSQEQIDAFVANLRFFIQDNERTSFRNLAKTYAALPLAAQLKAAFAHCSAKLNRWLASKSSLGMDGAPLTNRQVFETFVYGDIAHQNEKKRQLFDKWRQSPTSSPLWEALFVDILGKFTGFLNEAASLNKRAINYLSH
jgi:hypothetical protein